MLSQDNFCQYLCHHPRVSQPPLASSLHASLLATPPAPATTPSLEVIYITGSVHLYCYVHLYCSVHRYNLYNTELCKCTCTVLYYLGGRRLGPQLLDPLGAARGEPLLEAALATNQRVRSANQRAPLTW